jgi:DNA modification methylase
MTNAIRDRIVDFRRVRARELLPHPANWRRHPEAQREALRGMLEEIGYAGALLARQLPDGQLQLIDGHLRAETTPDHEVPVLVLDVTAAEAEKLLVSIDPLAALAERDDAALRQLLDRVGTENTRVQTFLDGLRTQLPPLGGEKPPLDPHPLPPGFADIRCGHVLDVLREMAENSVHCVVTSPPYWGLRDYGIPPVVWGGDPVCGHEWGEECLGTGNGHRNEGFRERDHYGHGGGIKSAAAQPQQISQGTFCRCGAWRGSLGLEPTPDLYVQHIVDVFREVRRVLREDGTLWLNMGDCYAAGQYGSGGGWAKEPAPDGIMRNDRSLFQPRQLNHGMKPKDLVGMPWRIAFALQQDGWYLRSDIVWSKPNPMPESVTDRPTKAHEYVFLLAKSERYYYDAEAIREPLALPNVSGIPFGGIKQANGQNPTYSGNLYDASSLSGRNKRTVWEIATQPYPDAHFATFPEALVEPCILAGTSERGCCPACGAPWARENETGYVKSPVHGPGSVVGRHYATGQNHFDGAGMPRVSKVVTTLGWHPTCGHQAEPVPCTVLDPFAGSGTALLVGKRLHRSVIGIELSEEYCKLITHRLAEVVPDG